jgi:hypothetical protein
MDVKKRVSETGETGGKGEKRTEDRKLLGTKN